MEALWWRLDWSAQGFLKYLAAYLKLQQSTRRLGIVGLAPSRRAPGQSVSPGFGENLAVYSTKSSAL